MPIERQEGEATVVCGYCGRVADPRTGSMGEAMMWAIMRGWRIVSDDFDDLQCPECWEGGAP